MNSLWLKKPGTYKIRKKKRQSEEAKVVRFSPGSGRWEAHVRKMSCSQLLHWDFLNQSKDETNIVTEK